jgi:predicted esterase
VLGRRYGGVIGFHGSLSLDNPPQKGEFWAKVLVLHGAADAFTTDEQLATFK